MQRERNRRGEGDLLRAEILTATARLLEASASDEGLSLRGVARAVGISPQSMYLHFPGLEDLIFAVLVEAYGRMAAELTAAAAAATDPVERVLARCRGYVAWGDAHPGLYQVMYEGQVQSVREPDDGADEPPGRKILRAVREDIATAMEAGAIPADDPDLLALQLWALVHGLVSLRANKPMVPWPDPTPLLDTAARRLLCADLDRDNRP